ncbi:MAG: hypothetical protein ACWGOX_13545 [Desulforhopalus sp.]
MQRVEGRTVSPAGLKNTRSRFQATTSIALLRRFLKGKVSAESVAEEALTEQKSAVKVIGARLHAGKSDSQSGLHAIFDKETGCKQGLSSGL